ncbi:DUF1330 domain-containing protein [Erythrobacter sp. Alg231-14]|uniref:DUF1330 domain-containing protein n=1 Tax=Erythrobacter sp. Alg231-14 TaxID=1922225 RepID=UPI00307C5B0D
MQHIRNALIGLIALAMTSLAASPALAQEEEMGEGGTPQVYVNSTPEAYAKMHQLPTDEPIYMLNLLRFNDEAKYEEGSEFAANGWTGEQAYAEYSRHSGPIAQRFGGSVAFAGLPQLMLIGPNDEEWDVAFIVAYPDLASFLSFVSDPAYREHAFHRSAAIADSRLVRMAAMPAPQ